MPVEPPELVVAVRGALAHAGPWSEA